MHFSCAAGSFSGATPASTPHEYLLITHWLRWRPPLAFGGSCTTAVVGNGVCILGKRASVLERQQVVISSSIPLSSVRSVPQFFNLPALVPFVSDSRTNWYYPADHPRLHDRALTTVKLVIYSAVRYSGGD